MHRVRGKHQQRAVRNLVFVLAGCKQVIPEGEKESKICPEQSGAAAAAAATTPISSHCKVAHGVGTHNNWPTAVTIEQIQWCQCLLPYPVRWLILPPNSASWSERKAVRDEKQALPDAACKAGGLLATAAHRGSL
jgi:hypothetical protein